MWGRAQPAGERLGSGASPAAPAAPPPEADAGPGNCRGPEPTFAPTAGTRSPFPAEVTSPAAAGGGGVVHRVRGSVREGCTRRLWGSGGLGPGALELGVLEDGPGPGGSWPSTLGSGGGAAAPDGAAGRKYLRGGPKTRKCKA